MQMRGVGVGGGWRATKMKYNRLEGKILFTSIFSDRMKYNTDSSNLLRNVQIFVLQKYMLISKVMYNK